jgi:RNA polymerase sigma factor (TIGR02999 family)
MIHSSPSRVSARAGRVASSASSSPATSRATAPDRPARTRSARPYSNDELFALAYDELKQVASRLLAGDRSGETLEAAAVVHEAYLRLGGNAGVPWKNRAHFFGAAANAIRRILVDRARRRRRERRAGGGLELPVGDSSRGGEVRFELVVLDEALDRLARIDAQRALVVKLRFYAGLTAEETAEAMGTSLSTVARKWRIARRWLQRELSGCGAG